MKLNFRESEVETSVEFKEFEFGIKSTDMGVILEILRSKMYKNPIAAICREISSNARDANREVEYQGPIEVTINSSAFEVSDMSISFKDNGPGISKDRMADIFVNYGASTKRDSDEQTGCFGLGAKTPFSYTDCFSITTVVEGKKYFYTAVVEEGKQGKIYLVNYEKTEDHTGTTITIPIKTQDRQTFEKEVYKTTMFWQTRPSYNNFTSELCFPELIFENEFFAFYKKPYYFSHDCKFGCLLDGIFYEVELDNFLSLHGDDSNYLALFKLNIYDVTISSNRENLQYDKKTVSLFKEVYKKFLLFCETKYIEDLNKTTSWYEAALYRANRLNIFLKYLNKSIIIEKVSQCMISKGYNNFYKDFDLRNTFKSLEFFYCRLGYKKNKFKNTSMSFDCVSSLKSTVETYFGDIDFDKLRDFTIYNRSKSVDNEVEYILIKPREKNCLQWKSLTFKEKRQLAKKMRGFVNDIEKLREYGFKYLFYSSVEKTRQKREANRSCNLKHNESVKVVLEEHRDYKNPHYIKVEQEKVFLDKNQIDVEKYTLIFVNDLLEISLTPEQKIFQIAVKNNMLPQCSFLFVNKNRGRQLLSHIQEFQEKAKLLTEKIISDIFYSISLHNKIDDFLCYINKINFKSRKFTEISKNLKMKKINGYLSEDILEYYKKFNTNNLQEIINTFSTTFPLIACLDTFRIERNRALLNVQQYINLVEDNLIKDGIIV